MPAGQALTTPHAVHRPTGAARSHLARVSLGAMCIGGLVRFSFVVTESFPLNDGGLFYLMTQELQRAGYRLPAYTAYNEAGLPFAYPPLGFYLAGLLDAAGPWSLLHVFRWLPAALSILTIAAFCALAHDLLREERTVAAAALAFALLPRSFCWSIMGGGITRSLGFLLAVLAVQQAYRLYTRREARYIATTAILAGCTALAHLEMAILVACSSAIFFLAHGRSRRDVLRSAAVAGGVLAVSAPWWATVILRHGLAPFLAAADDGANLLGGVTRLAFLLLTAEPYFPLLGLLSLLGALLCVAQRRLLLPIWVMVLFLLDPRSAHATASVPLALLAGIGLVEVVLRTVEKHARAASGSVPPLAVIGVGGFAAIYALVAALVPEGRLLTALSAEEREAMAWVTEHTPPGSTFVVVTGDRWPQDRSSEWFPVLAERRSVATVQGMEWSEGFSDTIERSEALQECASEGLECLEAWAAEHQVSFTHLYVAKRPPIAHDMPDSRALLRALGKSARYVPIYNGPGATIFRCSSPHEAADAAQSTGRWSRLRTRAGTSGLPIYAPVDRRLHGYTTRNHGPIAGAGLRDGRGQAGHPL